MVSLLKLTEITEEGVMFESPFRGGGVARNGDDDHDDASSGRKRPHLPSSGYAHTSHAYRLLLRPEDSILYHQNNIGYDIMIYESWWSA
jgi:hypothetical protein